MIKRPLNFHPVYFCWLILLHSGGFVDACRGRETRSSESSNGYEIVIPRKVKQDGRFVSHRIPHHFKRSFYVGRTKTAEIPDDAVHYRLQIGDEEHHLVLRPNSRLLAPGAVIEEHDARPGSSENWSDENFLKNMKLQRMRDTQCHYVGHVHGQSGNSALSTCYGLAGYIRTKRSWYAIEPVSGHDFTKEAEHPHVVYENRWLPDGSVANAGTLCNVTAKTIVKRDVGTRQSRRPEKPTDSYTLELMLVLDNSLVNYREKFDVENYALTLLNIASGLLRDASLGMPIELSVVRVIRMHVQEDQINISLNKDAEGILESFQKWQQLINPGDDSHPNHHDLAILLTKSNICESPKLCGFTGTSVIAGTCDPLKSAAVIRDTGLVTGYHIAHHIGHTIGMTHDVLEENGCPGVIHNGKGYIETTVMHPGSFYVTKRWSKCSKKSLKSYIESGLGFCLGDKPKDRDFPGSELLPGVMYDASDQCRLLYHQGARQCDDTEINCENLRCTVPGKGCVSEGKPPAEGTSCGHSRWCYGMKCLMVGDRPGSVDGGWSGWSAWSRCSRTCGSGVAFSVRRCASPSPSNGGAYCRGNGKRHQICATNPCDPEAPPFRDVQCSAFDNWVFPEDGRIHRWTAYNLPESRIYGKDLMESENPCALYCLSETNLLASLRPKVVDGTSCYRGIRDICIDGVCREIPCDLNMESNAVEDVCGVCRGNGTSCRLKEGTVAITAASQPRKIVDVPAGAVNVRVEETEPSGSRIMVRTANGKLVINGDRLGMFKVSGTEAWLGMIRQKQQSLRIPGPVRRDLLILVLPKGGARMKYSLGLKEKSPRKPEFSWGFVDWEKCSRNCGPGEQISKPRCLERLAGIVDETFCKNVPRPEEIVRPCHQAPCLPRWMIGDWQGCASCVPGCEKRRAVKCIRPVGRAEQDVDIIADSYCQGPKPKEQESCTASRNKRNPIATRDGSNKSDQQSHTKPSKEDNEKLGQDVKKDKVVVDKEDIEHLTLTILLERDEESGVLNFPKNFKPQPPANATKFTLVGMDAVRYIQRIQEDSDNP